MENKEMTPEQKRAAQFKSNQPKRFSLDALRQVAPPASTTPIVEATTPLTELQPEVEAKPAEQPDEVEVNPSAPVVALPEAAPETVTKRRGRPRKSDSVAKPSSDGNKDDVVTFTIPVSRSVYKAILKLSLKRSEETEEKCSPQKFVKYVLAKALNIEIK